MSSLSNRVSCAAWLFALVACTRAHAQAPTCDAETVLLIDTDQDGLPDVVEVFLGTFPDQPDSDGDGLLDGVEVDPLGSNPRNPDTDGDGWCDGGRDVIGVCVAGEDWDEDGILRGDDTDPVCTINTELPARRYPRVRGTPVTSGAGCAATGGDVPIYLLLAVLFGWRTRCRPR